MLRHTPTTGSLPEKDQAADIIGGEDSMAAAINRRTGRARRLGGGVTTLTLPTRLAYTAIFGAAGSALVVFMLKAIHRPDARVSGLLLFLMGTWAVLSLLILPYVWRSSAEWQRDRLHARRLQRDLQAVLDPRIPRHLAMTVLQPACAVCGQDGLVLVPERVQCSACQRPWLARTA